MTVVGDIGKGNNPSPLRLYSCVDMDGVIKITNGEASEKEAVSYKCVQCGAPLTFLPGDDKVTCEYCDKKYTVQEIETLYGKPSDKPGTEEKEKKAAEGKAEAAQEKEKEASDSEKGEQAEWDARLAEHAWSEEDKKQFRTFVCPSCGAELMTDATTMATTCCYCGNPTMIPGRFSGSYRPDWIIPFKKTRDDARKALEAFYRGCCRMILRRKITWTNCRGSMCRSGCFQQTAPVVRIIRGPERDIMKRRMPGLSTLTITG